MRTTNNRIAGSLLAVVACADMEDIEDQGGDASQNIYDDRREMFEHEDISELQVEKQKDASEVLLIPLMMIFLKTGTTLEVFMILAIIIFIVVATLR